MEHIYEEILSPCKRLKVSSNVLPDGLHHPNPPLKGYHAPPPSVMSSDDKKTRPLKVLQNEGQYISTILLYKEKTWSFKTCVWSFWCVSVHLTSLFFSIMIGKWRMPPFTSGLNPQVCLILIAFWRPSLWCLDGWNMNSEDRKNKIHVWKGLYMTFTSLCPWFWFLFQKMVSVFFLSVSNGMAP